jgi:polyhydroxybutyrate depolymerase
LLACDEDAATGGSGANGSTSGSEASGGTSSSNGSGSTSANGGTSSTGGNGGNGAGAGAATSGTGQEVGSSVTSGPNTGVGGGPAGCPAQALTPGLHEATISFDGKTRSYEVQVPASYDNSAPIPLVFDLHGLASSATQQQFISGWSSVAEANGFAVVRPSGYGGFPSWNGGSTCCGQALSEGLDDVGLMLAIVEAIDASVCIDAKRIYASGLSNGGAMTHRLGCDAAEVFAAIAPVAYPIAYLPMSLCQPSRPMPVMHSHGTNDTTVPYSGSFGIASASDSFEQWAELDGCSGDPVETYSKGDSHCDTYENCQQGAEVTLCTIKGPHLLYSNSDDVPIAELAWAFFEAHPMP